MVFRNFVGNTFFPVGPHRSGTVIQWAFGSIWAGDTERNSRPRPKLEKHNFPVLGVPKQMVVRKFLTLYVLTDRTPTGGKTRGHKTEKHNFPALRVPKSKKKVTTLSRMVVRNF